MSSFPDFYIIGAAKAGTTTLVDMLRGHEEAWFPHEKEPHHFFLREDRRRWTIRDGSRIRPLIQSLPYCREAEYLGLYRNAPRGVLKGDASTQYLVNDTTARAIRDQRPDAKIIAVLRHPTDRAYSAYVHARSRGEEACAAFDDAIHECQAGTRETAFATNYLAEGEYARHLKPYHVLFGENLLVILFEELIEQPQTVFDRLTTFLEISQRRLPDSGALHKNPSIEFGSPVAKTFRMAAKRLRRWSPSLFELPVFRRPYEALLRKLGRKPAPLSGELRTLLDKHFSPHIDSLEQFLGRDLSAWRR